MTDRVEAVAEALEKTFKARVSSMAGQPFEETDVTVPGQDVWRTYALSALAASMLFDANNVNDALERADLP